MTDTKKIIVTGTVAAFTQEKRTEVTLFCWDVGTGDIRSTDKTKTTRVSGIIPRWCSNQLTFSFPCYKQTTMSNVHTMIPLEVPRLDQRGIKLTAEMLMRHFSGEYLKSLPEKLISEKKFLCINMMALVYPLKAKEAVAKYDREHGTHFVLQLNLVHDVLSELKMSLPTPQLNGIKSIYVAQLLSFYERLFGVGFYKLMLLDIANFVVPMFKIVQLHGPVHAFRQHVFEFMENGFPRGKNKSITPGDHSLSFGVSSEDIVEHEVDTEQGSSVGVSSDIKPRVVSLSMTLPRALAAYNRQRVLGDKCNDDDDNDDAEEDAPTKQEAERLVAAMFATEKTKSSSSDSISISCDVNGKEIVFMSTDPRKVRPAPLDMTKLRREDWLRLIIVEFFKVQFFANKHFCTPRALVMDMINDINGEDNFPVKDVTPADIQGILLDMLRTRDVYIYDMVECRALTMDEIERRFGKEVFIDTNDAMMYALASILDIELGLCNTLEQFIVGRADLISGDIDDYKLSGNLQLVREAPGKIMLSDDQQRAVLYAQLLPFLCVNGGAGRGKSMILSEIFVIIRKAYPSHRILITAFKNDTINQTREALEARCPEMLDKELVIFMTTDMFIVKKGKLDDDSSQKNGESTDNRNNNNNASTGAASLKDDETIPVSFCFVDEAAMLSSSHMYRLFELLMESTVIQKIMMFGDDDQLEPINAGFPFKSITRAFPAATVTLQKNFRASSEKLNEFLEVLRVGDIQKDIVYDEFSSVSSHDSHIFMLSDVPNSFKTEPTVMKQYGKRVMDVFRAIDPQRTRYKDIMSVCPYNDMADFISQLLNRYYFEYTRKETSEAVGHTDKKAKMDFDDDEDDFDDALEYARGDFERRKKAVMYTGMDVVILKTDPDNKKIAAGRVCEITRILYHPIGAAVSDACTSKSSSPQIPAGSMIMENTREALPPGKYAISIALDGDTVATFPYGNRIHSWLKASKCRTVHRAQGRQAKIVVGIYPPGKLSNHRVWYTGQSRGKEKSISITHPENARKMLETSPDVRYSVQEHIFSGAIEIVDEFDKHEKAARRVFDELKNWQ